ncbi:MAG: hypothetical protein AAB873_03255 [Patescibacteria group bacterium]
MKKNKVIEKLLKYRIEVYEYPSLDNGIYGTVYRLTIPFFPNIPQLSMFLSDDVGSGDWERASGGYLESIKKAVEGKEFWGESHSFGNIASLSLFPDRSIIETLSHEGELVELPTTELLKLIEVWNEENKKFRKDKDNYKSVEGEVKVTNITYIEGHCNLSNDFAE